MAGAVEYFNVMCIAVSSLNRTAAMWLQAEPNPAIHVQLPDRTNPLSLFKQIQIS